MRQLVQVGAPGQDQLLPGGEDVVGGDGAGAVPPRLVVEAGFGAQRVHQPGLALGLLPHGVQRLRRERLAGLGAVLGDERPRLRLREVPQAQGLGCYVERAAAGNDLAGAGADAVVSDVAYAAQHHALWEALWALLVAGAKLAQYREQGIADKRVDLVDQQHQRRRVCQAPLHKQVFQREIRPRLG